MAASVLVPVVSSSVAVSVSTLALLIASLQVRRKEMPEGVFWLLFALVLGIMVACTYILLHDSLALSG